MELHHGRAAEPREYLWMLTPHVCGACLGRVLERRGVGEFRCSNCGRSETVDGAVQHPQICACAARVGKRDIGIRCRPNPRAPILSSA
jgi:hypothetical protein